MPQSAVNDAPSVLITGSSTGIGQACALEFHRRGFQVFAGVRREQDGQRLWEQTSDRLVPVLIDVTDAESIANTAAMIREATGEKGLVGLVNNAGITVAFPLEFIPLEELRRQLEVNVVGHVAVTQAMLPMLRTARGRIVNVSSISGRIAAPYVGPYAASKHALEAISDSLRIELRNFGIHVALIEPGDVDTPIWQKSRAAADRLRDKMAAAVGGQVSQEVRDGYAATLSPCVRPRRRWRTRQSRSIELYGPYFMRCVPAGRKLAIRSVRNRGRLSCCCGSCRIGLVIGLSAEVLV